MRNPSNKLYYATRALILINLSNFRSALKDCEKALELDQNYMAVWGSKATCHNYLNEYDKAIECYDRILALNPNDHEVIAHRRDTLAILNRMKKKENSELAENDKDIYLVFEFMGSLHSSVTFSTICKLVCLKYHIFCQLTFMFSISKYVRIVLLHP